LSGERRDAKHGQVGYHVQGNGSLTSKQEQPCSTSDEHDPQDGERAKDAPRDEPSCNRPIAEETAQNELEVATRGSQRLSDVHREFERIPNQASRNPDLPLFGRTWI